MNAPATLAYVHAAAALIGVPMDDARASAVAEHLDRTAAMARMLEQRVTLDAHDEPAELFCPAPFPQEDAE